MPTNTIAFHSVKGGSGCSTVAALFALQLHRAGHAVHLSTAGSRDDIDDVATLFAMPGVDDYAITEVRPGFTMGMSRSMARCVLCGHAHREQECLDCPLVAPCSSRQHQHAPASNAIQVIDVGNRHSWTAWPAGTPTVLVLRTDYLSIRRALVTGDTHRLTGLVVLEDPHWPLGNRQVSDVLGRPVLESFPCDDRFQRIVDSGLLVTLRVVHNRATANMFPALARLIDLTPAAQ